MSITPQSAAAELLRRHAARESLIAYANSIEIPGKPASGDDPDAWIFEPIETTVAAHHRLLLEAAQRCVVKKHGRLMVFMPPGSAKSTFGSIVVPTWCVGKWPGYRVILAAYGSDLARKHSRRARQIVKSEQFAAIWGCGISSESAAADEWALSNGSEYMSGGIMSGLTGNRANGIVIDDPVKGRDEAESEVIRSRTKDAYEDDLKTRLLPGGWIMLIQTRWHHDDLSGSILPQDWAGESGVIRCRDGMDWEVLCLPAQAVRADDPLGRAVGDYLWPEWFDTKHWDQFRRNERTWSALYQQQPSQAGGGILKRDQFKLWPSKADLPDFSYVLQSYDTAFTDKTQNDPTACTVWGIFEHKKAMCVMLLDAWSEHLAYPVLRKRMIDDYSAKYGGIKGDDHHPSRRVDAVLIEDKGSGIALVQDLRQARVPVLTYNPGRADKSSRAHQASAILDIGCVYILESKRDAGEPITWARPFLLECEQFPNGEHDDAVDCFSQAMIYFRDSNMLILKQIEVEEPDEVDYDEKRRVRTNPYSQ